MVMGSITLSSGGGGNIINLGSGKSFDMTSYSGYKNFTADNFVILNIPSVTSSAVSYKPWVSPNSPGPCNVQGFITGITKSYNQSTGILSCYVTYGSTGNYWGGGSSIPFKNTYTAPVTVGLIQ
jgi:hypothetical protein